MTPLLATVCFAMTCTTAPPFLPRHHSLTVETAFDGGAAYRATFGEHDWHVPAEYIDLVVAPVGEYDVNIRAAGIHTMLYLDANMCSAKSSPGGNEYASPDCGSWPASNFYAQPGHTERMLSARHQAIVQRVGDPGSSGFGTRVAQSAASAMAQGDFDALEFDDATPPDEYYASLCWGIPSFDPGTRECDGAAGGVARAPWGETFTRSEWIRGEERAIAAQARPVFVNGLAGDSGADLPAATEAVVHSPNAWGAICDGCFYGYGAVPRNAYLWTGKVLDRRLGAALKVTSAGKSVIVVNGDVTDLSARERALADIMLFYDADRTWLWDDPCGERSHIHACPESALAFYQPLANYPRDVAALRRAGGAYAREFAACYANGNPLGPCAAVVNPNHDAEVEGPALRYGYAHTLVIEGSSLCVCYGDGGSLRFTGPAPPGRLPPATGYVLFR